MDDSIDTIAAERFGVPYLFPYQRLVVRNILSAAEPLITGNAPSEDATEMGRQIVILPTGAGKSLCFQLPATQFPFPTLVVYPLLSLMNDQERRMSEAGFITVQLKGGMTPADRRTAADKITGRCDFILTNPETLRRPDIQELLRRARPLHAVLDEAHCISEWGDTFRDAYLTVGESLSGIDVPLITAFTATASEKVIARIREVLFPEGRAHLIRGNADRQNISYSVISCLSKRRAVAAMLRGGALTDTSVGEHDASASPDDPLPVFSPGQRIPRPAIIFCRTRGETHFYAAVAARSVGRSRCFSYHAGLSGSEKRRIEKEFFSSPDGVLAATCAYGMGVDKKNVRAVIHTYIPASVEAFLQESGRGGRDGAPALSVTLVDGIDVVAYRDRTRTSSSSPVEDVFFSATCRRTGLLRCMGYDQDTCGGCDHCVRGRCVTCSPGMVLATISIAVTPQRLHTSQWIALWQGRGSSASRLAGHRHLPGWGLFRGWRSDELEEGLENLDAVGLISLRRDIVYPRWRISRSLLQGNRDFPR